MIENFQLIWALCMFMDGQLIEHTHQTSLSECMKSKRVASRTIGNAGDLERVKRIVKLTVFVNASEDFEKHPQVADGASDLLEKLFGEIGQHARAAVGVDSLPSGAAVEIELIAEV